jgi:ribose/xylose/arabinose/galactoside ABC-type transport system permease subunit
VRAKVELERVAVKVTRRLKSEPDGVAQYPVASLRRRRDRAATTEGRLSSPSAPGPVRSSLTIWPKPGPATARQLINLLALGILVLVLSLLSDRFLTFANAANVLRQIATVVTVGAFFTLAMVAGGVDLSVSGVLALSGVASVLLVNAGVPLPVAFGAAAVLGALIGVVNGLLVAVVGLNTVIATLGTMYITRGSAQVLTGGKAVVAHDPGYAYLGNATIGPVPVPVIIMLIALGLTIVLERGTLLGRYAVLVGSNVEGARLSGVPTRATLVVLFALTGAAAGWAGVMVSSQLATAVPSVEVDFAFAVIIATLLGGTSLLGGEGSVVGLLLGALIVGSATSGMNILGVPAFVQTVLTGVVLLAAVGLDAIVRRRRGRPRRRASSAAAP